MFANTFALNVRTLNPGEGVAGQKRQQNSLGLQVLDAPNVVLCSTVFSCISCLPFRYLALLATQAAAARKQSGEWATWEDAKLGSRRLSTVGITKILYDDFVYSFLLEPSC